jgi:hypothetical protein
MSELQKYSEAREVAHVAPSPLDLIQGVISSGVTKENVQVVKELLALHREEQARVNKVLFNKKFFALRKDIAVLDIYADKAVETDNGKVAYRYCSEREIGEKLEPLLFQHGFAMMFGQRQEGDRSVAVITLIHEGGHEETREYAVRSGSTNRLKDATAADIGATTSAWRHLCIKLFGLKSRIREDDDVRNEGDPNAKVTAAQAAELEHRAKMVNADIPAMFRYGGMNVTRFVDIPARFFLDLDKLLSRKEAKGR